MLFYRWAALLLVNFNCIIVYDLVSFILNIMMWIINGLLWR